MAPPPPDFRTSSWYYWCPPRILDMPTALLRFCKSRKIKLKAKVDNLLLFHSIWISIALSPACCVLLSAQPRAALLYWLLSQLSSRQVRHTYSAQCWTGCCSTKLSKKSVKSLLAENQIELGFPHQSAGRNSANLSSSVPGFTQQGRWTYRRLLI